MREKINTFKHLSLLVLIFFSFASCGEIIKNKSSISYSGERWGSDREKVVFEVPLSLQSEINYSTSEIREHLRDVFRKEFIELKFVDYDPSLYNGIDDNKNRLYFLPPENAYIKQTFSSKILAVANMWIRGNTIREADIIFRTDIQLYFEGFSAPNGHGFDFWGIFLHELGHTIGLEHDDSDESLIMNTTTASGVRDKRNFTQMEIDKIRSLYRIR